MAIVDPNIATGDNQQQGQGQQQSSGGGTSSGQVQPVINGGAGGFSGAGGATGGTPGGAAAPAGQWTNLQNYMSANKDFDQAQGGLAGNLAGQIGQQRSSITNNINNLSNEFNTQAQTAASPWANYSASQAQAWLANPLSAAQDPNAVTQLQNWQNAAYTGPQNFNDVQGPQNLQSLQGQIQSLTDMGNQAQTESGRFNLLQQMYGGHNYSQGAQTLDNLFLQNPEQAGALNNVRQYGAQAQNALEQAQTDDVKNTVTQYQQKAQQAQQGMQKDLQNAFNTQMQADQGAYQNAKTLWDNLSSGLHNHTPFSNATAQYMGFTPTTLQERGQGSTPPYQNVVTMPYVQSYEPAATSVSAPVALNYGVNMNNYLKAAPTQTDVMTPDQFSKFNALMKIAAPQNITSAEQNFLGDQTQGPGTYTGPLDLAQYKSDISAAQQAMINAAHPLVAELNYMTGRGGTAPQVYPGGTMQGVNDFETRAPGNVLAGGANQGQDFLNALISNTNQVGGTFNELDPATAASFGGSNYSVPELQQAITDLINKYNLHGGYTWTPNA